MDSATRTWNSSDCFRGQSLGRASPTSQKPCPRTPPTLGGQGPGHTLSTPPHSQLEQSGTRLPPSTTEDGSLPAIGRPARSTDHCLPCLKAHLFHLDALGQSSIPDQEMMGRPAF